MKKYINHTSVLSKRISNFFETHVDKEVMLLLDGTGILSSYQNTVLSLIGFERLQRFKQIHLVSGSTYALFIFLAQQSGQLLWGPNDIQLWNKYVRSWHGITPVWSLFKFLTYKALKLPAGRFGGHRKVCSQILSQEFLERPLSSFSNRYYFWTYDSIAGELILLNSENEYRELTVADVISMACSIPSIFGSHTLNGVNYIDAMDAKDYPKFKYSVFKGQNVLHMNMVREGRKEGIHSLRIHEWNDGNKLIRRDFYRFLCGFKNPEFDFVTKYALFGEESI